MAKSFGRKLFNKGKKVAKKRYFTKKGLPKVGTMVKDVMRLKRLMNVEKKYVDIAEESHQVGQFSATSVSAYTYGYKMHDITPTISQGTTVAERTGNSVKLTGATMRIQVYHTQNQVNINTAFIDIFEVDQAKSINDTTALEIFDKNPFYGTSIIDSASQRNPNYRNVFKKIASRRVNMPSDDLSNDAGLRYIDIHLKLNKHLKFNGSNSAPVNCQYIAFYRASNGNISPTYSYSGGEKFASNTAITGYIANVVTKWWYVDN